MSGGYATVVVGLDGSDTGRAALHVAAGMAGGADARVVAVAADQALSGGHAIRGGSVAEEASELVGSLGVDALVVVRRDRGVAEALLDAATEHGAELIVVPSRTSGEPTDPTLGATANTVSHHATCDVLVVAGPAPRP